MYFKWIKRFLIVITVIPWSIVILLLVQIKSIVSTKEEVKYIRVDTIPAIPECSFKEAREGLKEALIYYDISHRDIVYAQAIIETGNFTSKQCLEYNNLFGLYDSKNKCYYKFNNWTESVIAYKKWIQSKYYPTDDYYNFLERINYAEDKQYIKELKKIVKQERNN